MIIRKILKNGKHSVYVQKKDIKLAVELNLIAPTSLFLPFIINGETITEENENDFLKYEEEEVWLFLSSQEWILNYDEFLNFSTEEFLLLKENLFERLDKFRIKLKNTESIEERINLNNEIKKIRHFLSAVLFFEKAKNSKKLSQITSNRKRNSK